MNESKEGPSHIQTESILASPSCTQHATSSMTPLFDVLGTFAPAPMRSNCSFSRLFWQVGMAQSCKVPNLGPQIWEIFIYNGFHFSSHSFYGIKGWSNMLEPLPRCGPVNSLATTLISWELLVLAHKTLRSHWVSWSYDLSWSKSHHAVEADHWCHLPSNRYFDWQTWHRSVDSHKPHQQHLGRYLPLEVGVDCSLAV